MGTVRADTITDGAGTGKPNFSQGLTSTINPTKTAGGLVLLADAYIKLEGGNGHGSTNTRIRRFTGINSGYNNPGTAITYADSATLGGTFTINEAGIYSIDYTDGKLASDTLFGASVNSTELTTSISSIATADRIMTVQINNAGGGFTHQGSVRVFAAADVLRMHTDGGPDSTSILQAHVTITQLVKFA